MARAGLSRGSHRRAFRVGCSVVVITALITALAACGSGPPRSTAPEAVKPPIAFGPGVALGSLPGLPPGSDIARPLPAVLEQATAYLASTDNVRVVDTRTSATIATIRPRRPPLAATPGRLAQPVVGELNGVRTVLWPFLVSAPSGGPMVELAGIRTDTHAAQYAAINLPAWTQAGTYDLSVTPLSATEGTVVLNVASGLRHAVLAADPTSGAVRWSRDDFTAGAVAQGTVVGSQADVPPASTAHVTGLSLDDGRARWSNLHGYGWQIDPAGPDLIAVEGQSPTVPAQGRFQLLSAATGAPVATLPIPSGPPTRCRYDEVSVTVCSAPTSDPGGARTVVAIDAHTGQQLWSMPNDATGTEPVPRITAAWHGLIYATTIHATTMIYDARTGLAEHSYPGSAPVLVNDRAAITVDPVSGQLIAHRPSQPST